jgi:TRAP transporter TAXI family solute receptor
VTICFPDLNAQNAGRERRPLETTTRTEWRGKITRETPRRDRKMRIGTAQHNSTFLSQGLALKTVLEKHGVSGPVEILVTETASTRNVGRLHVADIDFGFIAANWVGRAKAGQPPFEQPVDLRLVAPMNAGPMFFVTLADSGIRTVMDLRGKRVSVGPQTSGVAQHARSILGALGIGFDQFTPIYLDFAAGADALAKRDVDAQLQRPIPNKVMTELNARADIRVVPYEPADLETVLRKCAIYRKTTMRKGALRGLQDDVVQPAVVNVLVTHARVNAEMVRQVAATCIAGADELASLDALFIGMSELLLPLRQHGAAALEFEGVKLHEGALRAYRDAGLI